MRYANLFTGSLFVFLLFSLVGLGTQVLMGAESDSFVDQSDLTSVELGILELSPRGVAGGYAMPASGCGDTSHGAVHDDDCSIPSGLAVIDMDPMHSTGPAHQDRFNLNEDITFNVQIMNRGDTAFAGRDSVSGEDDRVDIRLSYALDVPNCNTLSTSNSVETGTKRMMLMDDHRVGPGGVRNYSKTFPATDFGLDPNDPDLAGRHCFRYRLASASGYTDANTGNDKSTWRRIYIRVPTDAVCGSAHNTSQTSQPTSGSARCAVGLYADDTDSSTQFKWFCGGLNGGDPASCSATIAPSPVNGSCGTADGQTYVHTDTSYGSYSQCSTGSPSSTAFPSQGNSASWTCSGSNGGDPSASCTASRAAPPPPATDDDLDPDNPTINGVNPSGQRYTFGSPLALQTFQRNNGDANNELYRLRFRVEQPVSAPINAGGLFDAQAAIIPGSFRQHDSTWTPVETGNHTIQVLTENSGTETQYNQDTDAVVGNDDSAILSFQVVPQTPTNFTPSCNAAGTQIDFTWNSPSGTVGNQFAWRFDNETQSGWTGTCSSVNAGDECQEILGTSRSISINQGDVVTAWVHARGNNLVHSDSANITDFTCPTYPDLNPDDPTKTGGTNSEGSRVHTFESIMHNDGSAASGGFDYQFEIDYAPFGSTPEVVINPATAASIPAGDSITLVGSQTLDMPNGTHRVRLVQSPVLGSDYAPSNNTSGWTEFTIAANANVVLSLSDNDLVEGEPTSLRWSVQDAVSCTATGDSHGGWSNIPPLESADRLPPAVHTRTITPTTRGVYTYGITCNAAVPGTSDSDSATLTVRGPVCSDPSSLEGDKRIIESGDAVELTFSAGNEGADCTLSGPGVSPGTYNNMLCGETITVNPTNNATYQLICDDGVPIPPFKINVLPEIQET